MSEAAAGFLDWLAGQAHADRIDHLLFALPAGDALHALSSRRAGLARLRSARLAYAANALVLARMTQANYAQHLPYLMDQAAGDGAAALLERIGAEIPASHVLQSLGLAGRAPPPRAFAEFLLAWKWRILKICRQHRRELLRSLVLLGIRPGDRVGFVALREEADAQAAFTEVARGFMTIEILGYYFYLNETGPAKRGFIAPGRVSPELLERLAGALPALDAAFTGGTLDPVAAPSPGADDDPLAQAMPLLRSVTGEVV